MENKETDNKKTDNELNINEMEKQLIDKLYELKNIMDSQKAELEVSIRKDVVAIELKDMIISNPDWNSLKTALEEYINKLYKI